MLVAPLGVASLSCAIGPVLILRFRRGAALQARPSVSQPAPDLSQAEARLQVEIAENQRLAAALRDSEERFACAFDAAPVGMMLIRVSESPATVWTNRAFRSMLGYEDAELINPPADRFIFPDDLPQAYEDARRLSLGEIPSYQRERRLVCKDGRILWTEVRVSLTRDANGAGQYMISMLQDITARKDAQAALLHKTAELEAVFEAVPDMFFRVNAEGTILGYLGSSRVELFTSPQNFIGNTIRQVLPEQPAAILDTAVTAVCRDRLPRTVEYGLSMQPGWRIYEARVWPLQDREAVAIVRDVTETRQRQEQLAHLLRVTTMSEMAATLAHEVHQPLQVIINFAKGCVERLQRHTVEPLELREPLEHIAGEATRAGQIVRRMREFLRTRQPQREWTNLNEVVVETVRMAEPDAMRQGVSIELDLAPDLPASCVDPIQMQQVVLNLVRNSLDALAAAARSPNTLLVATSAGSDGVRVAVRDSGLGFSPEVAERLFTPLFTTKPQGLGMGLAISRAIVEAHGGSIRAACEPGGGTVVEFTLPVDRSVEEPASKALPRTGS